MSIDVQSWLNSKGLRPLPPVDLPAVAPPQVASSPKPTSAAQRSRKSGPQDVLHRTTSMSFPNQPIASLIPVLISPIDAREHGIWASMTASQAHVAAVASSYVEGTSVGTGLWLPASSPYSPPADLGPMARWTGDAVPEPLDRILSVGGPVMGAPLDTARMAVGQLRWKPPLRWLDARVQLCTVNLDGEFDEVAAFLSGSTDISAWSSLKGFTGIVGPQESLAEAIRKAVAMSRLALGVAAVCGCGLETPAEEEAWTTDQVINARGLPVDRTLVQRVLSLGLATNVTTKFSDVERYLCADGRVRGTYGFRGQRSGRWNSREPALHNHRKTTSPALAQTGITQFLAGESLSAPDVADLVGNLERPIFCAPEGMTFVVGDQKQAEPRGVFYFAGLTDVLELMDRVDLYFDATLQQALFGDAVTKDHPDAVRRRMVLKIAIIACGFGMGAERLQKHAFEGWGFDLTKAGVDPARVIQVYRGVFAEVPGLWKELDRQSVEAVGRATSVPTAVGTFTYMDGGDLSLQLRSGRAIVYPRARLVRGEYGHFVEYWRGGPVRGKWKDIWGGTFLQNAVTGTLRDVHAGHLVTLNAAGLNPIGHCHDEAVGLVPATDGMAAVQAMGQIMSTAPDYLPGLRLRCTPHLTERLGAEGLRR